MYSFLLTLTKTDAQLELREGDRVIAEKSWQEAKDMGRQLFEAIQSLLQENGLGPIDVDKFELKTAVSDNFTSVKIAETVMKVYNWSVSVAVNNNQK
ncbi:MAG: hypothetical protein E6P95_00655 [Candidatus Moraniibacteriota bacterium]|nr:MAG: hypothetical protein E6P95_00655 [Candidatus Moranbacteria bacterium]